VILQERIAQIVRVLEVAGLNDTTVAALRERFADMHFTYCMDDDVTAARPVAETPGFNVYLVDGREHCLRFTTQWDAATGVVLAAVDEVVNPPSGVACRVCNNLEAEEGSQIQRHNVGTGPE
jgi:hypothetical protein